MRFGSSQTRLAQQLSSLAGDTCPWYVIVGTPYSHAKGCSACCPDSCQPAIPRPGEGLLANPNGRPGCWLYLATRPVSPWFVSDVLLRSAEVKKRSKSPGILLIKQRHVSQQSFSATVPTCGQPLESPVDEKHCAPRFPVAMTQQASSRGCRESKSTKGPRPGAHRLL